MSRCGRRRLGALAVVVAGGLLGAACGLSAEKRPHEISDRAIISLLPSTSSTTTPSSGINQQDAALYFVLGERLKEVSVPAGGPLTPDRALTLLLNGIPRNAGQGITSSIPPGTTLRDTSLRDGTLRIDLAGPIKSLGGTAAKAAFAQLVFTALELPEVNSVRFAIQGEDIDAITDDGSLTTITAKNYRPPLNPR